jgi:hypothetical protein
VYLSIRRRGGRYQSDSGQEYFRATLEGCLSGLGVAWTIAVRVVCVMNKPKFLKPNAKLAPLHL